MLIPRRSLVGYEAYARALNQVQASHRAAAEFAVVGDIERARRTDGNDLACHADNSEETTKTLTHNVFMRDPSIIVHSV